MKIEYKQAKDYSERKGYTTYLKELTSRLEAKRVCDIGGGSDPSLTLDFLEKYAIECTLLDISSEELAKSPNNYIKIQADITSPNLALDRKYDLVCSRMLAEHVPSGLDFHRNVLNILNEGGYALHFFPTLYALPFIVNHLLPNDLSGKILRILQPHRGENNLKNKFPAYYSWCKGPLKEQIESLESLGYEVEEYICFFGNPSYYRRFKPLLKLDEWLSAFLVKHPIPLITSYAYILLRKSAT